jgi:hypothetical protein
MHRIPSGSFAADAIVNNAQDGKWFRRKKEFFGTFCLHGVAQLTPIQRGDERTRVDGLAISPLLLPQR